MLAAWLMSHDSALKPKLTITSKHLNLLGTSSLEISGALSAKRRRHFDDCKLKFIREAQVNLINQYRLHRGRLCATYAFVCFSI
jgi:hypothetical protein